MAKSVTLSQRCGHCGACPCGALVYELEGAWYAKALMLAAPFAMILRRHPDEWQAFQHRCPS